MKTVFDESVRAELINRIKALTESNTRQWGKITIYQMVRHCILWEEWIAGRDKPRYKRAFISYLVGKIALRIVLKDEKPLRRNTRAVHKRKVGRYRQRKNEMDSVDRRIHTFS